MSSMNNLFDNDNANVNESSLMDSADYNGHLGILPGLPEALNVHPDHIFSDICKSLLFEMFRQVI